jgi:serine protease Do
MNARYLPLFAASLLLATPLPTISAPAQIAYETRSQGSANEIYQRVNPAVVTVFAGREIGSGSVVSGNGLIITNNHVIREVGPSGQVSVRTANGQRYTGRVVAVDRRYDLALIQVAGSNQLPTVPFASQGIQPGEAVFAIGSPYGRPGVMTAGTFSSARINGDLQSRVVLNPGNSGGPLLNDRGELVGINKAILESARGSNTGISIATSAQIARQFIEQNRGGVTIAPPAYSSASPGYRQGDRGTTRIPPARTPYPVPSIGGFQGSRATGSVVVIAQPESSWQAPMYSSPQYSSPQYEGARTNNSGAVVIPQAGEPAWQGTSEPFRSSMGSGSRLGVVVNSQTLVIQQVETGSAAANSGLQVGDRLLEVNGSSIGSFDDLQAFMNQAPNAAQFVVNRDGRSQTVAVRF